MTQCFCGHECKPKMLICASCLAALRELERLAQKEADEAKAREEAESGPQWLSDQAKKATRDSGPSDAKK